MWNSKIQQAIGLPLALLATSVLSACGSQAYDAQSTSKAQNSPGTYQIPAKVDIILAQSDMGSMLNAYQQLQAQFPAFLSTLQSTGWDYHFGVVPLTNVVAGPVGGVLASQYDANWGGSWVSPYPGAVKGSPGSSGNIESSLFTLPTNFNGFGEVESLYTSNNANGLELGLQGIAANMKAIQANSSVTQIIRDDALLVVIVLSPEDDDSGLTFTTYDGYTVLANGETWSTGLSNYQADLVNLKAGIPNLSNPQGAVQFYAAVAGEQDTSKNCLGSNSWIGTRYQAFASKMGGASYDICTDQISGLLSGLQASLQATRLNMETDYLFISTAPNLATLTVTKYPGGNTSDPVSIPEDANNGWSYVGYVTNQPAIDSPIPLNYSTGYAIKLNGSAKLEGNDTATVNYTGAGLQNTAS